MSINPVLHSEFLEKAPPGSVGQITDLIITDRVGRGRISTPDVPLFCKICDGQRLFYCLQPGEGVEDSSRKNVFLLYICRNCRRDNKTFAVCYWKLDKDDHWSAQKFGEQPAFGPPVPPRTISLVGPDRDAFLKGRRCENQGLGVGAFVYYRRVVENQKGRIFDEIIRVSRHLGVDEDFVSDIVAAKAETQFTKAVDAIKHAIPQSLLINGHNPLLLLHSALSQGVHNLNDEACLELAHSIRIVLVEFAERLAQAVKDEVELNEAVARLTRKIGS